MVPKCCKIGCDADARWSIWQGHGLEDYTQACTCHVGDLLNDAPEQRIYPIQATAPVGEGQES